MARAAWLLLFLSALAAAQEPGGDGCGEGCGEGDGCGGDDEAGIVVDSGTEEGTIEIEVDPYDQPALPPEPNRPPPIEVGTWQPPDLDDAARHEMEDLLLRRGESIDDASVRYRLAEFYLGHGWLPQAEAEFLSCAPLDPDSIRPWEGLLRVYAVRPPQQNERSVVIFLNGLRQPTGSDWIQPQDRGARVTNAWREIVKRRPDDVAKRREFLKHLKKERDAVAIEAEAREILARLPGDADTRFDLAEAIRRRGVLEQAGRKGAADEALAAARGILEENLKASPSHAASALRLARIIGKLEGPAAEQRIADLEERAFFTLFVRPELMPVEFRQDTARMARSLAGPDIARNLWDSALAPPPPDWNDILAGAPRPPGVQRWIFLSFPHAQPRDQMVVLDRLARRGDRDAAGILLAFLWHVPGPDVYVEETAVDQRAGAITLENAAVDAAASLGTTIYPGAERFLKAAQEPRHRRRAASLMRKLKDPRAVAPLCEALAWDVEEQSSYGVAAALEELGDPKAVPALVDAALDVRRPIPRRREAAEALAAFKDARAIEAMSRLSKEQGLDLIATFGLFRLAGDEAALGRLGEALCAGTEPGEVVRLLRKCDPSPRIQGVLERALDAAPPEVHPLVVALLRERYAESSRECVKRYVLKQAQARTCPEELLGLLGELGGEDAATCLLGVLESSDGTRWAKAARALARTGDARGVRYFSKTRITDPDPGRRRLAEELYETASARRAELDRASKNG
ncbi:MAG TPA: HEAT repeat domain-containing protein [Planctomycetota bacterium]|nr:HEAT repeat domain-containing protein [Planctomycetota bacterium]